MLRAYSLDWKRPVTCAPKGEHHYHATDGTQHILVILSTRQLRLAQKLATSMRARNPETLIQDAVEEAIATALVRRPDTEATLRLADTDFG